MFSRIHSKLGTAGLIVAVVALVAALAGGAYAANNGLNKKQKKQVRNIAKNLDKNASLSKRQKGQVRNIAQNFPGPEGPAGPQGPAGPAGADGANGAAGADGKDGATGPTGPTGAEGAAGAEGPTGSEGSPWTVGGVLPSGETLTGAWGDFSLAEGLSGNPVSFPIPLASAPEFVLVKAGKIGAENAEQCPGYVEGTPTAAAGVFCVYVSNEAGGAVSIAFDPSAEEAPGTSTSGSMLLLETNGEGPIFGTWAVTAE